MLMKFGGGGGGGGGHVPPQAPPYLRPCYMSDAFDNATRGGTQADMYTHIRWGRGAKR